jgi:hypothetical protein
MGLARALPLMNRACLPSFLALVLMLSLLGHKSWASPQALSCLLAAYPEFLKSSSLPNAVQSRQGEVFFFDASLPTKSHQWRLDHADLKAQMEQPYPRGPLAEPPAVDFDPGRLRSAPFFEHMYGQTLTQVQEHMVGVYWAPCKCRIQFSKRNGGAAALEQVGEVLANRPELLMHVSRPLGSLNWRSIQGTQRRSMHAYGVAVDFHLPKPVHHYWQWSGCKSGAPCPYPAAVLKDERLQEVVKVFEAHGFIWGGKWHHFDTVHFEFRPELIGPACGP